MWRQSLLALAVLGVLARASAEGQQSLAPLNEDKEEGVLEKALKGVQQEVAEQSRQESEIAEETVHTLLRRKDDYRDPAETGATGAHGAASGHGAAGGGSADAKESSVAGSGGAGKGPKAAAEGAVAAAKEARASAEATRLAAFEEDSERAEARNAGQ